MEGKHEDTNEAGYRTRKKKKKKKKELGVDNTSSKMIMARVL